MQTASHNIANAGVAGYTRETTTLGPNLPDYTPWGALGTGVVVTSIDRVRDSLLDGNYRMQAARSGAAATRRDLLTSVSSVLNEPSDSGLASTLDRFWSSWSDLANDPTSTAARSVVQQRGAQLAGALNRISTGLDAAASDATARVNANVGDINKFAAQIAQLNQQIVVAETGRQPANDLRDQRDRAVDALAQILPVRTAEQPNGSLSVYITNGVVVDGATTHAVSAQLNAGVLQLTVAGQPLPIASPGGALGAAITVINTEIPAAHQQLDALTAQIVTRVNTAHRSGWTAAGDAAGGANWNSAAPPTGSNIAFFDPSKTTAGTIALSTQVASSASYIAAGSVQNAPGNNAVANQIAGLRSDTSTITKYGAAAQTSFAEYYRDFSTRLGVATSDATSDATVYETLARQADTQRQSVSGVSTDEELIEVTKRQQAYAAAAKVITTATEMSQTLLNLIR